MVGETSEDDSNLTLFGVGGSSLSWILLYLSRLGTVGFGGESTETTEATEVTEATELAGEQLNRQVNLLDLMQVDTLRSC